MSRFKAFSWFLLLALSPIVGCGSAEQAQPIATKEVALPTISKPGTGLETEDRLTEEELAEIKKLPAEDQKLAIEQKICPVGEGHLGDPGMGPPIKVMVKGTTVFLCCKGCLPKTEKEPDAVLASLAALKQKKGK